MTFRVREMGFGRRLTERPGESRDSQMAGRHGRGPGP